MGLPKNDARMVNGRVDKTIGSVAPKQILVALDQSHHREFLQDVIRQANMKMPGPLSINPMESQMAGLSQRQMPSLVSPTAGVSQFFTKKQKLSVLNDESIWLGGFFG